MDLTFNLVAIKRVVHQRAWIICEVVILLVFVRPSKIDSSFC